MRKLSIACLLLLGSCHIDDTNKTNEIRVSETIEKSKANGVFLAEYEANMASIEKAWVEIPWRYNKDGSIEKNKGKRLYIVAKGSIGLARTLDRCINGDTSNGNEGRKEDYLTMQFSEEELAKDSLSYYVYEEKEKKCLGKLILIKKR